MNVIHGCSNTDLKWNNKQWDEGGSCPNLQLETGSETDLNTTEEDHLKIIKSWQLLLSYNAYVQWTKLKCIYETNKLKMHTTGVPTLKKKFNLIFSAILVFITNKPFGDTSVVAKIVGACQSILLTSYLEDELSSPALGDFYMHLQTN